MKTEKCASVITHVTTPLIVSCRVERERADVSLSSSKSPALLLMTSLASVTSLKAFLQMHLSGASTHPLRRGHDFQSIAAVCTNARTYQCFLVLYTCLCSPKTVSHSLSQHLPGRSTPMQHLTHSRNGLQCTTLGPSTFHHGWGF